MKRHTSLSVLSALTVWVTALCVPSAAHAFWFLPGFGGGGLDSARAAAVGSGNSGAVASVGVTDVSGNPLEPVPFSEDLLSQPIGTAEASGQDSAVLAAAMLERPLTTQDPQPTALQSDEQAELAAMFTDLDEDLATAQTLVSAESLVSDVSNTGNAGNISAAANIGPMLQDAALTNASNVTVLSAMEFDRVLPSGMFDDTYDISDGLTQDALSTFPMVTFVEVRNGDTLSSILQSAGIAHQETIMAARSLGDVFNLGSLRPGQIIELELDGAIAPFEMSRLRRISITPTNLEVVHVRRAGEAFASNIDKVELVKVLVHAKGTLTSGSIYVDGASMDIEGSVIANYVNALDAQLNFSRIQSGGDEVEMVYEAFFNQAGKLIDAGDVLYARYADQGGETYEAVRFKNRDKTSYYTREARFTGQVNTLMRKPVGGGRLTSGFGWRIHPVHGGRRMHNGVDYGAACGTPIYAAGNGVLTFVGWKGGYGKFIGIKHGSTYATNYAHMKSFANGMRPGVRVRKGQLIGRVGTTGVSTGCHLHFEVVKNGSKINPLSTHIPRGDDLAAATRQRFRAFLEELDEVRTQELTLQRAMARATQGEF